MMSILNDYIQNPYPVWDSKTTDFLVNSKWQELGIEKKEYLSSKFITNYHFTIDTVPFYNGYGETIFLEGFSKECFGDFYNAHGLVPHNLSEFTLLNNLNKLKNAISIFDYDEILQSCIVKLVRSIQLLNQPSSEIDLSYSHPKIPFTIFVSLCESNSIVSDIRVAESILHEAMHLKLSLLEAHTPLVRPFTGNLYYSPWRDEKRPAKGILHGLFVFTAIREFYLKLVEIHSSENIGRFLKRRITTLSGELSELENFKLNADLEPAGKLFTSKLLEKKSVCAEL